jgi:hypothetical protein
MSAASRAKGVRGEHEVASIFTAAGLTVRGLEGSGDHLIVCRAGLVLHSEVKRRERINVWELIAQMEAEAPQGTIAAGTFRRNRMPWYSLMRTTALAELLA